MEKPKGYHKYLEEFRWREFDEDVGEYSEAYDAWMIEKGLATCSVLEPVKKA